MYCKKCKIFCKNIEKYEMYIVYIYVEQLMFEVDNKIKKSKKIRKSLVKNKKCATISKCQRDWYGCQPR